MSDSTAIPAPASPRLGHVLVSSMKDEGVYVVEWVAHHRVLGFDGIFVASNNCTDGTDRLLDTLARAWVIGHSPGDVPPGGGAQPKGYQRLRAQFGLDRAEWLMALDVDEFLFVVRPGETVQDLTALAPADVDVIALNGMTFGTSDPEAPAGLRVCRRFTNRVPPDHPTNGPVKSLTRGPARFDHIHNHSMVGFRAGRAVRAMGGGGTIFDLDPDQPEWRQLRHFDTSRISHKLGFYAHFAIKSPEEFMLRRQRGRGVHSRYVAPDQWDRHTPAYFAHRAKAATIEDRRLLKRYGAAVEAEMARLRKLPGVAEAEAACRTYHEAAIARLDDEAL